MSAGFVRTPPPCPLGSTETLETLTHWRTTFKTFFKRDDTYKPFIKDDASWDPSAENYNQRLETTGLKRPAADMKEDLLDLLNILSGFLPHSYLTDKIVGATKNWKDVWNVIHDHYGVQVTSESLLDFESLHKQTGETHRQFYECLLQHVKQHLAPAGVKVEQITTASADKMSVSMMNMVALQWLRKTDPALIKIVRTEYSTELRSNTQLAELVPRISLIIDSLLTRYNQVVATNKVEAEVENDAVDMANVNKTWEPPFVNRGRGGRSRGGHQSSRGRHAQRGGAAPAGRGAQGGRNGGPFCPGCYYLSNQLGTTIHFRHVPSDCPRKAVTVKMFQMEDTEWFDDAADDEDYVSVGKITEPVDNIMENEHLQETKTPERSHLTMNINVNVGSTDSDRTTFSHQDKALNLKTSLDNVKNINISEINMLTKEENSTVNLTSAVHRLEERMMQWSQTCVRKEKSPMVSAIVNNKELYATIDEGSEINCIDEGFAVTNNLKFVPTSCKAMAAGSNSMKLAGQTVLSVFIDVQGAAQPIKWNLGKMVVVANLGVDILIGEPGKVDNKIVTIPHHKVIEALDIHNKKVRLPYSPKKKPNFNYVPCRVVRTETIYQGGGLTYKLPPEFRNASYVNISPRRNSLHPWLESKNLKVIEDGSVLIENNTDYPVELSRHEHFADIQACEETFRVDLIDGTFCRIYVYSKYGN